MVEFAQFAGPIAERKRARDNGAGRRSADEIEPIAEPRRPAFDLVDERLQPLQKSDRDRAADAAAVERKHALGTRPKKVPVARRELGRFRLGHG
jgi:hypothetical protein